MKYQPRYEAYLKTTNNPKNWEFMSFIADMKKAYGVNIGAVKGIFNYFSIVDHDDFTSFIEEEVEKLSFPSVAKSQTIVDEKIKGTIEILDIKQ